MHGDFLGCSNYPDCTYTKPWDFEHGECPECGSPLREVKTKFGTFLGCTDYPDCEYQEWIEFKYGKCPDCGGPLNAGDTYYGEWLSCIKCDYFEKTGW